MKAIKKRQLNFAMVQRCLIEMICATRLFFTKQRNESGIGTGTNELQLPGCPAFPARVVNETNAAIYGGGHGG